LGETQTQSKKKKWQNKKGNGNINDWKKSPNPRGLAQPLCKAHGNPPHDYSINKELALDFEEKEHTKLPDLNENLQGTGYQMAIPVRLKNKCASATWSASVFADTIAARKPVMVVPMLAPSVKGYIYVRYSPG
jgi:hypothetical protein